MSVSDPDSPQYGKHKSFEQIADVVHAFPEGVAAVKEVFEGRHGIRPSFTIGEGFAMVDLPVSLAEAIFSAKFYQFQHRQVSSLTTTRTLGYMIPASLKPHLDFICCMDKFPDPKQNSTLRSYSRPNMVELDPGIIEKEYNLMGYKSTNSNNSQAIAGFLKQYFSPKDLERFQLEFGIDSNPIVKVIGMNNERSPGGEASLDVQYITGTVCAFPTSAVYIHCIVILYSCRAKCANLVHICINLLQRQAGGLPVVANHTLKQFQHSMGPLHQLRRRGEHYRPKLPPEV